MYLQYVACRAHSIKHRVDPQPRSLFQKQYSAFSDFTPRAIVDALTSSQFPPCHLPKIVIRALSGLAAHFSSRAKGIPRAAGAPMRLRTASHQVITTNTRIVKI